MIEPSGDAQTTPAKAASCRCGGTGAYTAEIAVLDAVVLVRHLCADHAVRRTLVKERSGAVRTGELMAIIKTSRGPRAYVRPRGGGLEWEVDLGTLEPAGDPA